MMFYWEQRVGTDTLYFGDSDTYWVLGQNIAEGKPYLYHGNAVHRMPGYPALLAPLFLLFDGKPPVIAARIENVVIGSLTVLAVAWLAFLLFKNRTLALLAGWFTALDPLNIVMNVLVLSETPFCLTMILQLCFWIKSIKNTTGKEVGTAVSLISSGLFAAAAVYCRPSWLYFVPFAAVLGIVLSPQKIARIFISGFLITQIGALCLVPWWIRNEHLTGHFVSTTLQAGASLYDGLNPDADGGSDMKFAEEFRNAEMKLTPDIKPQTLEYKLNQTLRAAAVNWAVKHPAAVWKLVRTKFFRFWNFVPNEPSFSGIAVRLAVFCTYTPVLLLGLIGVVRSFRKDFTVQLLWVPAVYLTLLHIVFVSSIRYRAPVMLCFAVLAAWTVVNVNSPHHKRRE
ncbi:MAG: phospholipid carrier-dependent glycosyltransferase [Planctomycetaceae bacterium]|nr:phospholipid carrier-dependent glycosyltransferase [Planctomycetaceae bacterium]